MITITASLPNLFLSYLLQQFFASELDPLNHYDRYGILVVITLVLSYVNFRGLDIAGYSVSILFVISTTPVILMVVLGIPKGEPIENGNPKLNANNISCGYLFCSRPK